MKAPITEKAEDTKFRPACVQVETCLARIAAENDRLHAVSKVFEDQARLRAAELDRSMTQGTPAAPLHGLPILVKELVDIEGHETEFGSLVYASSAATFSAPVIKRLEEAGAIILGTTHMVEFAIGSWGTNHAKGTPWNPADGVVHRVPGGSSSGSAVAVAAGLVPAAIGSDTGGSIRIPASLCGVIGFKPTYGLIPTSGVAPLGPTFDTLGPITRTVEDARRLTEVMSDIKLDRSPVLLAGLTAAVINAEALAPISDEVAQAFSAAIAKLRHAGVRVNEISLPRTLPELQALNGDIVAYEAYRHLGQFADDPSTPLDPHVRNRILAGRKITDAQYQERLAELASIRQTYEKTSASVDFLALPGTPLCAPPLDEVDESQIPMSRYTRLANCLDLCAISLPLERPEGSLPIGLQLCAKAHSDAFLLSLAEVTMDLCGARPQV